ncbi:hypothetical protein HYV84_00390 [Candidatus Woesearchaeota archaeon]|nr:hypothetical protein [Candidatus Woesearchaeota archaeon]
MKRIILDTNTLLIPSQCRVDIFSELERVCLFPFEVFTISQAIKELGIILGSGKGKDHRAAALAIAMVKRSNIGIADSPPSLDADKALLAVGKEKDTIIATQDQELKRMLKKQGTPVITLRSKKYFILLNAPW